ncbi:hypothetical protein BDE02_16G010200 [Populus trichocarpa]|nr:hypothetical protein BDE02_16G010200 [Populus trichocarpa]
MAKLFPKLVSSLAVLLLLCQFGYVACQPTGFSNSSRYLPDGEGIKCNCTYENSTVCHVTGLDLSNRELDGQINATALTSLHYLEEM